MTDAVKSAIVKPTLNVPMRFAILFADQVEGKYGPQLRLKGVPEGAHEPAYVYLPVDCANELIAAGAVAKETPKGTTFAMPATTAPWLWTILKAQAAGEKYPTTTLTPPNGTVKGSDNFTGAPTATMVKHVEAGPGKPPEPASEDADAQLVRIWKNTLEEVMAATAGRLEDGAVMSGVSTLFIARSKLVTKSGW